MHRVHRLKTKEPFYTAVKERRKTFELRRDDRGFEEGDCLVLQQYDEEEGYSGEYRVVVVSYVLRDFPGLLPGWVILGIK